MRRFGKKMLVELEWRISDLDRSFYVAGSIAVSAHQEKRARLAHLIGAVVWRSL